MCTTHTERQRDTHICTHTGTHMQAIHTKRQTHTCTHTGTHMHTTHAERQIDTYTHICILHTLGDRQEHIEALEHSYTRKSR